MSMFTRPLYIFSRPEDFCTHLETASGQLHTRPAHQMPELKAQIRKRREKIYLFLTFREFGLLREPPSPPPCHAKSTLRPPHLPCPVLGLSRWVTFEHRRLLGDYGDLRRTVGTETDSPRPQRPLLTIIAVINKVHPNPSFSSNGMLGDKEEMGMTEVTRNGIGSHIALLVKPSFWVSIELPNFKASHDVRKKSASSTINPTIRIPLQDVYRTRSNLFFISFWAILFIMTNFVFFYFSINDFQISQIAWYATV
eukprot:1385321-Amorphochlora_amoeboformis.AAC.1